MQSKQIQHMLRNPRALMNFQLSGRLPIVRKPQPTPLWLCLSRMTPRERLNLRNITLSPALGYNCRIPFRNAEQLWQYLGGQDDIVGETRLPSESRIIRSFRQTITPDQLQSI